MIINLSNIQKYSDEDLAWAADEIRSERKHRQELKQKTAALKFRKGDWVEFDSNHVVINGQIKRINAKTITLENCSDGSPGLLNSIWNVSPSLLREIKK